MIVIIWLVCSIVVCVVLPLCFIAGDALMARAHRRKFHQDIKRYLNQHSSTKEKQ